MENIDLTNIRILKSSDFESIKAGGVEMTFFIFHLRAVGKTQQVCNRGNVEYHSNAWHQFLPIVTTTVYRPFGSEHRRWYFLLLKRRSGMFARLGDDVFFVAVPWRKSRDRQLRFLTVPRSLFSGTYVRSAIWTPAIVKQPLPTQTS